MSKSYGVNEIFYSMQGEGRRTGEPSLFLRFRGCNLTCNVEEHGFDCDTEWVSGKQMTLQEILVTMQSLSKDCKWIICTGGEPALQVDKELVDFFHDHGYKLAIETNGTIKLPDGFDWVTVSPKTAEHTIKQQRIDELKYVRRVGQELPVPSCQATHKLISPAFDSHGLTKENLEWCAELVKKNPEWKLSVQAHKFWGIR